MMKSFAILSALTTAAFAASSTGSAASSSATATSLIPSGISDGCSSYMKTLDSNTALSACTAPLIAATAKYGPGGDASTPTTSTITSALDTLCSSSTSSACSESSVKGVLADFYTACTAELTSSPNEAVGTIYDVIYTLIPFRTATCSKDDSGKYCATESTLSSSSSGSSTSSSGGVKSAAVNIATVDNSLTPELIEKYLVKSGNTRRATQAAMMPNVTTYQDSNLLFLFLQPGLDSATLCTSCTKSIMTSYISWESDVPYGPGLSSSTLLAGQTPLYQDIISTCGKSFLSSAVTAAGGISGGVLGGAPRSIGIDFTGTVSSILGVAAALGYFVAL